MAADETDFPIVMRGYDRGLVDDSIKDFRKELINLTNLNSQLAAELRQAQNRLIELETDASEAKSPSYAGVGAKAAQILSTAEELALRLVVDAETERAGVLSVINAEVEQLKVDGQEYYDELVAEAQRRSERIINSAKADYDETLAKARYEAERIIEEATREAGAIRGAISTEVARMRASSKREIEVRESASARELAERRLIMERQLTAPLTEALATALLSERARIDLDLELTARRAEAEATYQMKYQEAVAQTQKYLDDANSQLSTALTKLSAARLEAETLEAAAKSINKSAVEAARTRAEEIILAAESEARSILAATQVKVTNRVHIMESAERKLANERDSIMVYLNNLKQVIDQVSKDIK